ncbi:MAG: PilZ domain-containing protein [Deltaproteobacteria bacterium]|nr:PilZ domain-containing protein [Deltaproteobacteria bacterium]
MKHPSILVCCDAGALGRELLTRRDIALDWALTIEEALAVVRVRPPRLVVTREDWALPFLKAVPDLGAPVVVLLEADGWERRQSYSDAGATALVRAANKERIAEAIGELTGLSFGVHPRVPYQDVVDAWRGKDKLFLETLEMSTSGVVVRDFAGSRVGDRVKLDFVMLDPPLSANAMVVRKDWDLQSNQEVVGLCFADLSDQERNRLERLIKAEVEKAEPLPEPVGLRPDLSGTYSLDLFATLGSEGDTPFRVLLRAAEQGQAGGQRLPHWLERVGRSLTLLERRALLTGVPDFASAAVDVRIGLARALAESLRQLPTRDEGSRALEFCRTLAEQSKDAPQDQRAEVPQIRVGILRAVYGAILGPRTATQDLPLEAVQALVSAPHGGVPLRAR